MRCRRGYLTLRTLLLRFGAVALGIALLRTVLSLPLLHLLGLEIDYASLPPQAAYRRVFGQPVPDGVSEIQAAGTAPVWDLEAAWMRFRATPEALTRLTRGAQRISPDQIFGPFNEPRNPRERMGLRKLGWDDVGRVRQPQVYLLEQRYGCPLQVIVDRERQTVYLFWWAP
jgi:hypothetical protein